MWRVVGCSQTNQLYNFHTDERVVSIWASLLTWNRDTFPWLSVSVLDRSIMDTNHELSMLRSLIAVVADFSPVVDFSRVFPRAGWDVSGSSGQGVPTKLIEFSISNLRTFKRCLQKVSPYVLGSSDPFFMGDLNFTMSKGALDDASIQSPPCDRRLWTDNPITSQICCQFCGFVAAVRISPQGDRQKTRWRQLSGILPFWFLFLRVVSVSSSICFDVEENNLQLFLRWTDGENGDVSIRSDLANILVEFTLRSLVNKNYVSGSGILEVHWDDSSIHNSFFLISVLVKFRSSQ